MVGERIILPDPALSNPVRPGCGPLRPARDMGEDAGPLRRQIFESVRATGTLSRIEAARILGVSPGSVTAATTDLIAAGYLQEVAAPARDGDPILRGRPPVALAVCPGAGIVAGIKIAEVAHSAVLHDFAGNTLADVVVPGAPRPMSRRDAETTVERLLDTVLARGGIDRARVLAVGVGLPGFIDGASGTALWSPLLDVRALPFAAALSDRLSLPVLIDNDANLLTLAELWFGDGRDVANFAVVTIEHGVGMGLVLNNRLYRGARGLGTELGHTKVQLDGALCRCGQRGCLEAYVADYALLREASTALDWTPAQAAGQRAILSQLHENAKAGNAAAQSIFRRAGRYLAVGLANVVNLFDPELIILSGERMEYDYLYADEVLRDMNSATIRVDRPSPRVEIHVWGDLIWARGAAALALNHVTAERLGATGTLEEA